MRNLALSADTGGDETMNDDSPGPELPGRAARTPRKGNVLLVDQDEFLLEMIESGLSLSRPEWNVISTHHPAEAIEVLGIYPKFDAIVSEVVFDHSAVVGKAFIQEVGQRYPEISIFAMTSRDSGEIRGLDAAEYISKPPDIDFIVSRVDRAIRRQRESVVRGISLQTFLQIMELEKKTCTVLVSHAGRAGEVCFRGGQLIQARLEGADGEEALFAMLSMPEHGFRVVDRCDAEKGISTSLTTLLLRWSVREDHGRLGDSAPREEDSE
jgi:response regulator RpfG family c-di-GMP phosphodiesterase